MGTGAAAKRPANGLRNLITNDELRMTNIKQCFWRVVFLGVFYVLAGNSFAQNTVFTQAENDFLPIQILLQKKTAAENIERKRDALFQLRNYQTEAASRVAVPALKDSSEIVRAAAAFSVIFLPKDEAVQILLPLLKDKSAFVRRETAYALGKVQNPAAIDSLLQTFQTDKISEVKNACIIALGEIGDVSSINFLVGILLKKSQSQEEFLRRSAARSIGQIAQIIQIGKIKVLTPENFLPDEFDSIVKPKYPKIVESFPALRPAINVLIAVLQNTREFPDVKREAAFALGAIGDESAILILQAYKDNQDYYLAEIARESLRKISFNLIVNQ